MEVRNEDSAPYSVTPACLDEDAVVRQALDILQRRLRVPGAALNSPEDVKDYLMLRLADLEHEEFHCLFLDVKNRLIESRCMFVGTLTSTAVYPREVVKAALDLNAAHVIIAHNHPSGQPDPSTSDIRLTDTLKSALALVDVRMLDHIIAAGRYTYSFAEHGQI